MHDGLSSSPSRAARRRSRRGSDLRIQAVAEPPGRHAVEFSKTERLSAGPLRTRRQNKPLDGEADLQPPTRAGDGLGPSRRALRPIATPDIGSTAQSHWRRGLSRRPAARYRLERPPERSSPAALSATGQCSLWRSRTPHWTARPEPQRRRSRLKRRRADLQHGAVQALGREVQRPRRPAARRPGARPPWPSSRRRLAAREPEGLCDQRGQVDARRSTGGERRTPRSPPGAGAPCAARSKCCSAASAAASPWNRSTSARASARLASAGRPGPEAARPAAGRSRRPSRRPGRASACRTSPPGGSVDADVVAERLRHPALAVDARAGSASSAPPAAPGRRPAGRRGPAAG